MKLLLSAAALAGVLLAPYPSMASGPIEQACLSSDRPSANRALCGCLQTVADAVLSAGDQRRGAAFFADPEKSQQVKSSDRKADDAFWERWVTFADTAVKHCQ